LVISGTFQSQQRLPASIWKIGILRRLAGIAESAELVSPRTSSASGRSRSSTSYDFATMAPIVSPSVPPATSRK